MKCINCVLMKLNMLDSDFDFFVFWELPCMQNCFIYLRHYYFLLGRVELLTWTIVGFLPEPYGWRNRWCGKISLPQLGLLQEQRWLFLLPLPQTSTPTIQCTFAPRRGQTGPVPPNSRRPSGWPSGSIFQYCFTTASGENIFFFFDEAVCIGFIIITIMTIIIEALSDIWKLT